MQTNEGRFLREETEDSRNSPKNTKSLSQLLSGSAEYTPEVLEPAHLGSGEQIEFQEFCRSTVELLVA